jgi:hypothetical protein
VVRWPRAIAQYTVGHLERVARAETLAEPLGVVLAGSSYHGVAVNSCTADATRVAHRVAARLALAAALALAIGAAACSGGPVSGPASGALTSGDAGAAGAAQAGGDGEERGPAEPPGPPGSVDISVEWLSPPAELVTSAGRNECGAPRRPPLSVGSLGGVEGAVVRLEGVSLAAAEPAGEKRGRKKGPRAAELAVRRCGLEPRAVRVAGPGAPLALTSFDEARREVALEWVPEGKGEAALLARVPLVLVGQRVEVGLEGTGLVHATSAADPASDAWVVVPEQEQAYVAVSDARGRVRFEGVPPGKYQVSVWHPPVADKRPPLTARAPIEVTGGAGASATVSLAPRSAAGR